MGKKSNISKSKRSNIIIAAVGAAAILLVVALLVGLELEPMLTGSGELSKRIGTVENSAAKEVIITDFYSTAGAFPDTLEVTVGEADGSEELQRLFLAAAEGAKFRAAEKSVMGSWDINLKFICRDGKSADFYITETEIYIELGIHQYYFTPADAQAHTRLYEAVCEHF